MSSQPSGDRIGHSNLKMLVRRLAFDQLDPPVANRDDSANEQDWPEQDWPEKYWTEKYWTGVIAAGLTTGLLPALIDRLRVEETSALNCKATPNFGQLDLLAESFAYRRRSQRLQLKSIVGALNAAGIEPLLMSAAQDVWLDANAWRFADELAIHVEYLSHAIVETALRDLGYQSVGAIERARYHRETCWCHPQTSGYVVLRRGGSNRTIERLFPWRDLSSCSERTTVGEATARVLPAPVDALLALIHHHFGRTRAGGIAVAPKELYEFARAARGLDDEQLNSFWDLLQRNRKLQDPVMAWLDAAERCFGLLLPRRPGATLVMREPVTLEHAASREIQFLADREGYRIALRTPTGWRAKVLASISASARYRRRTTSG